MARSLFALFLVCLVPLAAMASKKSEPAPFTARSAIALDHRTGEVLWEWNPDQPLPPASTTKVLTALLALESDRLEESFSFSRHAAQIPPSKIALPAGARMRLHDLVYAILLNSANDASVVIAEGLAGSVGSFATRMNERARRLGARNSHFVNPNGLPADGHVSSARDLALIFRHAMSDPRFVQAVNTRTGEATPTGGTRQKVNLKNHNRLLGDYHRHVVGKTGWTRAAKKCFVGAAFFGGREVDFAILGSDDIWSDIKILVEHAVADGPEPRLRPATVQVAAKPAPPRPQGKPAKGTAPGNTKSAGAKPPAPKVVAPVKGIETAAAGPYAVHLGTYATRKKADSVRAELARRGYAARVEELRQRQSSVWRVDVGRYTDAAAARRMAQAIGRDHRNLNPVVARR